MGYSHGIQWTEEDAIAKIVEIVNSLNLDHFPTHSEMALFFGNRTLGDYISYHGGTKYWAEKTGYKIKDCESKFGEYFEIYSLSDIESHTGLHSYKNKVRYPYDVTTNCNIKIDVKSSTIVTNGVGYKHFSFNLEKKEPTCDIYIFYCIDDGKHIAKTYIIPSCVLYGKTQVAISAYGKSIWDKYMDKWELINRYDDFYNETIDYCTATLE